MTLFDPAPAEPAPEPDIVLALRKWAERDPQGMRDKQPELLDMIRAASAIEYLRDANARLVAENNTLRAELRAARGEEGR